MPRFGLALGLLLSLFAEQGRIWVDVPFLRQEQNGCGAACLTMLGRFWRAQGSAGIADFDPRQIHAELYVPSRRGIPAAAMEQYLKDAGFQAFAFRGEWQDLAQHLSKGRPLIACLGPTGQTAFHYVVVAGVDTAAGAVFVNDPARRKLTRLSRAEFERAWSRAGNWTLLAVPAKGL